MKEYSFITESESYTGGDNFWKDSYQALKFGAEAGKDAIDKVKKRVADKLKLNQFAKNHPSLYKSGNVAISGGSAAYSYYWAIMNGLMAKKITTLINDVRDPSIDTRTKAVALFLNLGYIKDDLIDIGDVKSVSVNYEVSSKIAGPAIQIIKNPLDDDWKNTLIEYLKRQRMYLKLKAATYPIAGTTAAVGIAKILKK